MGNLIVPNGYGEAWQHRAVRETGGNQTKLGCYVLAVLNWQHGRHPPRFGSKARINADGYLVTNVQEADRRIHRDMVVDTVQEVTDSFRGLADRLKLSDAEREALFAELRKWIAHDDRANQTAEERGLI